MINVSKISKKYIILLKEYASEAGEKSSKFFLNLDNFNGMQCEIRKILVNYQEITDPNRILNEINFFINLLLKMVTQKLSPKLMVFSIRFRSKIKYY